MRMLKAIIVGCCAAACLVIGAPGQIDDDHNGLGDVWELAFGVEAGPDVDSDGDGFSNREEAQAGTDPHSAADFPKVDEIRRLAGDNLSLRWKAVAGIQYQAFVSPDLKAWVPAGEPVIGKGHQAESVSDVATSFPTGGVARSKWSGLTSGNISTLKSYASAGTPVPQSQDRLTELRVSQSVPGEDNFGQWIRGWIVPPASDAYRFWIASDDSSELWISTNASAANKVNVASVSGWTGANEWTKFESQKSAEIQLVQKQAYYFEIYHREYTGGDHVTVAWTRPGMAEGTRDVIGAPHLASEGLYLADMSATGRLFVKLRPDHVDSDGDCVMDYEEQLLGLDPANPASTPRVADLAAARKILASPSVVTLGVSAARAHEAEGVPAKFTVFGSGGMGPLTVPYQVSGSALAGIDYTALPGSVRISAGQRVVEISVAPLADGILETQETVVLELQADEGYELGSPFQASVFQFPLNQAPGLDWNFNSLGGLAREQILTALDGGRLWARVLTGGTTAILGLSRMHRDGSLQLDAEGMPIPTYTQDDTVGLAHVFTGWGTHYDDADPPRWSNNSVASRNDWFLYGYDAMRPMTFYPDYHDQLDRKILGGVTVAAGANGIERMSQALDALANHPNVGPFMAKQLIQKFVTSNPSGKPASRHTQLGYVDARGGRGGCGSGGPPGLRSAGGDVKHPEHDPGPGAGAFDQSFGRAALVRRDESRPAGRHRGRLGFLAQLV